MPALTAIISGQADPFRREMESVVQIARRSGVRIGQGLGSKEGFELAQRPIFEMKHALRDLAEGNVSGALLPIGMLANHYGVLGRVMDSSSKAAVVAAEADREVAQAASLAALSSTQKMQAAYAALYATGGETEANLAEAVSAEEKAIADKAAALASMDKAAASEIAAASAEAESVATVSSLGIIGIALAALVGIFLIYEYRVKSLTAALSGVKLPDTIPSDIGRLSAYEQGWRKVTDAIRETKAALDSANTAFEFNKKSMDQSQKTEKTMLEMRKQTELDRAGSSPMRRAAIVEKYNKLEHDMQVKQNKESEMLQQQHILKLNQEAEQAALKAASIHAVSAEDEKNTKENLQKDSDALNKKDEKTGKSPVDEMVERNAFLNKKAANKGGQLTIGENGQLVGTTGLTEVEELERSKNAIEIEAAMRMQKRYNEYQLAQKQREEDRKTQQELLDDAKKASADKLKAEDDLAKARILNNKIVADDDAIRKLSAQDELEKKGNFLNGHLTNNQTLGAFAGTNPLVDINKQMLQHLASLDGKTGHGGNGTSPQGGTQF